MKPQATEICLVVELLESDKGFGGQDGAATKMVAILFGLCNCIVNDVEYSFINLNIIH